MGLTFYTAKTCHALLSEFDLHQARAQILSGLPPPKCWISASEKCHAKLTRVALFAHLLFNLTHSSENLKSYEGIAL